MLLEEDVIMRIPNVNGADRYTLVTDENRNFMICSSCGKIEEFNHDFNIKFEYPFFFNNLHIAEPTIPLCPAT